MGFESQGTPNVPGIFLCTVGGALPGIRTRSLPVYPGTYLPTSIATYNIDLIIPAPTSLASSQSPDSNALHTQHASDTLLVC